MTQSRPNPSRQRQTRAVAPESREAVCEFLVRKLPPAVTKDTDYLADALFAAGVRYDRYVAENNEDKWRDYTARRRRFEKITRASQTLINELLELDVLSRDDLSNFIDPIATEALVGSLHRLRKVVGELNNEVQKKGKPRNLAEERWIHAVADIYENAFGEPARVWRSEDGLMSDFYQLLELSRPESFPRHGKLGRRQIDRVLTHRNAKSKISFLNLSAPAPGNR